MVIDPKVLGRNITIKRGANGWTQNELAKRLKTTQPYINRLESGKTTPRPDTIERLARIFEVPPETLLKDLIQIDYRQMIDVNLGHLTPTQVRLIYQITTEFRNLNTGSKDKGL